MGEFVVRLKENSFPCKFYSFVTLSYTRAKVVVTECPIRSSFVEKQSLVLLRFYKLHSKGTWIDVGP